MLSHEFLSIYPAKLAEYALAVGYMMAFVGWWKYVTGGRREEVAVHAAEATEAPKAAKARAPAGATAPEPHPWFTVPEGVWLHPGHTWARESEDGTVTVGVDDFAHKLVGAVSRLSLPKPGAPVAQGVPGLSLSAGGKVVPLVSPVDGVVSEVNTAAADDPALLADPYAQGWLFKVHPARLKANARQLLDGDAARRWLDAAALDLAARVNPELGRVLQDGGAPVAGIAQELDPDHWDEIARRFFLTHGA